MLHCGISLFLLLGLLVEARLSGSESIANDVEAQTILRQAMGELKASDVDPQKTIAAALEFTRLMEYYQTKGDTDQACDMQANIYWCRKRMDLGALKRYVSSQGASAEALAAKAESVSSRAIPNDQAEAYFARAEKFAQGHPDSTLEIAIRYFEVADRFAGSPVSLKAQRLSLDAQRKFANNVSQPDRINEALSAQLPIAGELPNPAKTAIAASNASAKKITAQFSSELEKERQRAGDLLLKAAEIEQKKGNLDTLIAIQTQIAKLDEPQEKLPKQAMDAMYAYGKAKARIQANAAIGINGERKKLLAILEKIQSEQVRIGNMAGALAIKESKDELTKPLGIPALAPDGTVVGSGMKLPKADAVQNLQGGHSLLYYSAANRLAILGALDRARNLASSGKATASSQYANRNPDSILQGNRDGHSWTLNGGSGTLTLDWPTPINGRYVVLINRTSGEGKDPWGGTAITVNGKSIGSLGKDFAGNMVLIIDLGSQGPIKSIHFAIDGSTYPGLAGLEIYP